MTRFHGAVILPYISTLNWYIFTLLSDYEYDQSFDPNILIGHCDLISRFSEFATYLGSQLVCGYVDIFLSQYV